MEVELEWYEGIVASVVGVLRRVISVKDKRTGINGQIGGWSEDIEGAAAECAFAKSRNVYWSPSVNTFKTVPDVDGYEVRHTTLAQGSLIVRHRDSDTSRYVLVTGRYPKYKVVGSILGINAKQAEYLRAPNDRPSAFFVPQDKLKKLGE